MFLATLAASTALTFLLIASGPLLVVLIVWRFGAAFDCLFRDGDGGDL